MSTNTRVVHAPVRAVWEVLADGWLYPLWVVGASRVRDVDASWPQPGARIHHSVGVWPLLIDDDTEVLRSVPEASLTLRARAWPAGAAEVTLSLEPRGEETAVTIAEDAIAGPGAAIPSPVRQPLLRRRNTEALRRFAYLAERRHAGTVS